MEDLNRMSDSDKLAYIEAMDNQCCVEDAVIRSVLGIQNELVRQKAVMLLEEKARGVAKLPTVPTVPTFLCLQDVKSLLALISCSPQANHHYIV